MCIYLECSTEDIQKQILPILKEFNISFKLVNKIKLLLSKKDKNFIVNIVYNLEYKKRFCYIDTKRKEGHFVNNINSLIKILKYYQICFNQYHSDEDARYAILKLFRESTRKPFGEFDPFLKRVNRFIYYIPCATLEEYVLIYTLLSKNNIRSYNSTEFIKDIHIGVLIRPTKELVEKTIGYYKWGERYRLEEDWRFHFALINDKESAKYYQAIELANINYNKGFTLQDMISHPDIPKCVHIKSGIPYNRSTIF